jgi:hypothetical protein
LREREAEIEERELGFVEARVSCEFSGREREVLEMRVESREERDRQRERDRAI